MCRLDHKGCRKHKRGCESRQDIYEKLDIKVRKTLQYMGGNKPRAAILYGKMKIDVPTSPQGVAVTKHRVRE